MSLGTNPPKRFILSGINELQIVGTATEESWPGVTRLPEYNTGKCVNYRDVIWKVCSIC